VIKLGNRVGVRVDAHHAAEAGARLGHALITRLASLMSGLPLTAAREQLACEVADAPTADIGQGTCTSA
jgi:hypothetical protein